MIQNPLINQISKNVKRSSFCALPLCTSSGFGCWGRRGIDEGDGELVVEGGLLARVAVRVVEARVVVRNLLTDLGFPPEITL